MRSSHFKNTLSSKILLKFALMSFEFLNHWTIYHGVHTSEYVAWQVRISDCIRDGCIPFGTTACFLNILLLDLNIKLLDP